MKPFRLTRRALGSAVCMTLLAGTVLFTSPTPVHAAAQGKDTLVFVNYRDLRDLNPHLYAGEMFAQEMVFEGLVTLGNDGKYHGAVAESWDISPDGRVYTFKIRPNLKFTDGHVLDAYAVKANFDALIDNKTRHSWLEMMRLLEGVEAPDANTFVIKMKEAYYPMLTELAVTRPFAFVSPNVMKDGKAVRMSKRAGNVVTIDDLTDAIGVDASRYSLARTDYNSPVDIDLNLLASHSNENPVYYVQYAHARSCNVDRNAAAAGITYEGADVSLLDTAADGEVLAALAQWPALLREAGDLRAPHRVAHYLEDLAATYHKWYNVERVVPMELTDPEARGEEAEAIRIAKAPEPARAAARLKLNDAVQTVIAEGLDLLGVAAPDKM